MAHTDDPASMIRCEHPKSGPYASPCDGPQYIARRYYANGNSSYRCRKHAAYIMRANPTGPRYVPSRGRRR